MKKNWPEVAILNVSWVFVRSLLCFWSLVHLVAFIPILFKRSLRYFFFWNNIFIHIHHSQERCLILHTIGKKRNKKKISFFVHRWLAWCVNASVGLAMHPKYSIKCVFIPFRGNIFTFHKEFYIYIDYTPEK